MPPLRPLLTALLVIVVSLALAPGATAATASSAAAAAAAKERAYGKHCGVKRKGAQHAASRTKCLAAMAKLATGRSSSPRAACRTLSRKKAKGQAHSPFARCVRAGAKLLQARGRDNTDPGAGELDEDDLPELDVIDDGTDPGDLPPDGSAPDDPGDPDDGAAQA